MAAFSLGQRRETFIETQGRIRTGVGIAPLAEVEVRGTEVMAGF